MNNLNNTDPITEGTSPGIDLRSIEVSEPMPIATPAMNSSTMKEEQEEASKLDEETEHKHIIIAKVLFGFGFVIPLTWLASIIWARKTKSREVYRWRRYSLLALSFLIALLFCAGWCVIIVYALIPYPDPEKFNSGLENIIQMYPGELIAILWGVLIVVVVCFEFIKDIYWRIKKFRESRRNKQ
ncbi:hypothetical protein FDP41_011955 [Naegleria fowleri]|uniref:Uncharacterized protein n=1 Tax=Naegleria fowleri TaxID=5763 RepID=A0A6A5C6H9_NAEFO|nr:uncharacterized protein FDP41_011955 [Naegleria fowleri]KAF0982094.1 hypothetical protein FDP41_011955 [Naegleria fowleri]CAG4711650.1 unnamed protein product [Naegleria fowleri]